MPTPRSRSPGELPTPESQPLVGNRLLEGRTDELLCKGLRTRQALRTEGRKSDRWQARVQHHEKF